MQTDQDGESSQDEAERSLFAEPEGRDPSENIGGPSAPIIPQGADGSRTRQTVPGKAAPKGVSKVLKKKKSKPLQGGPSAPRPNFAIKKNHTKERPPDGQRVLIVLDRCAASRDYLH